MHNTNITKEVWETMKRALRVNFKGQLLELDDSEFTIENPGFQLG